MEKNIFYPNALNTRLKQFIKINGIPDEKLIKVCQYIGLFTQRWSKYNINSLTTRYFLPKQMFGVVR